MSIPRTKLTIALKVQPKKVTYDVDANGREVSSNPSISLYIQMITGVVRPVCLVDAL